MPAADVRVAVGIVALLLWVEGRASGALAMAAPVKAGSQSAAAPARAAAHPHF
jgi:hypothetical protein